MELLGTLKSKLYPITTRYMVNATIVEGILRGTGQTFRLLFAENSNLQEYICSKTYESTPRVLKKWKIFIPDIKRAINKNSTLIDLCIAVLPQKNDSNLSASYDFKGQEWVQQLLDISGSWQTVKDKFHKNPIETARKIRKYGLKYEISRNTADFNLFYYHMYLPLMRKQFGNSSHIDSFEEMKRFFLNGFLLLVYDGDQPISGGLCLAQDDTLIFRRIGVLDADEAYLKKSAQSAIYYFIISYAKEHNFNMVDLMKSRAFINDGVYGTKRGWGTSVCSDVESETWAYLIVPHFSKNISSYFESNPMIIHQEDGLYGLTGRQGANDLTIPEKKELYKKYYSPGLKGMILLAPDGEKKKVIFKEDDTWV